VTLVLVPLAIAAMRRGARVTGGIVLALLAVQLGLGATLVVAALPFDAALAHNFVAALLLTAVASLL
jgi:heme A synthase